MLAFGVVTGGAPVASGEWTIYGDYGLLIPFRFLMSICPVMPRDRSQEVKCAATALLLDCVCVAAGRLKS